MSRTFLWYCLYFDVLKNEICFGLNSEGRYTQEVVALNITAERKEIYLFESL